MGRKSVKANKNAYQISREAAGLTRERAGELMSFVSDDRIEKIESERSLPHPEEVLAMSRCYRDARLCNYYCSHECPIGQIYVPEIELKSLSQITLETVNAINSLEKRKNRLIEIAVDGRIDPDEQEDFDDIKKELDEISEAVQTLRMWIDHQEKNPPEAD
ncbi:MAG: helix-turn-helix domain-containing protein [Lachnospiraceae bacterium]|nr:helix-turn-helix domain-containing protein [Lachnospiraceae bacterium]